MRYSSKSCVFLVVLCLLFLSKRAFAASLESSMAATHSAFVQTYRAAWQGRDLEKKLGRIVKGSVHAQTKDFMWGTRSVRLLFNQGHVVDRIQADISNGFSEDYDKFLAAVEESFASDFQKLLVSFYQKAAASAVSEANSPFERAFIRQSSSGLLKDSGAKLTEELNREVAKKYPRLMISGSAIGIGLTTTFFRDRLVTTLVQKLGVEALAKGIGKKLISTAVPVFGVFMTAWGTYDFLKMAYQAEDQLAKSLHKGYCSLYANEAPEQFWSAMKDIVQETFEQAQANIVLDQTRAKELSENSVVKGFTDHMSSDEAIRFAERLALLSREAGIEVNDGAFINRFGVIVRSLSDSQFRKFVLLLNAVKPYQLMNWLEITSIQDLIELSSLLPKEIWSLYLPDSESLMTLTWVATSLPNASKNAAAKVSPDTLAWVRTELPIKAAVQLLKIGRTTGEIEQEVRRMKSLPKSARRPWQSDVSYTVSRMVSVLKWIGIAMLALLTFAIVFRLYWYFFSINAMREPVTFEPYSDVRSSRRRRY